MAFRGKSQIIEDSDNRSLENRGFVVFYIVLQVKKIGSVNYRGQVCKFHEYYSLIIYFQQVAHNNQSSFSAVVASI